MLLNFRNSILLIVYMLLLGKVIRQRGINSCGMVAQLVEFMPLSEKVVGLSPGQGPIQIKMAATVKWP